MALQAGLGLALPGAYRDPARIRAAWSGTDAMTLLVAVPLLVAALVLGGVLLWRRRAWGVVVSAIAAVQAALYLLGLSAGTVVGFARGLAEPPGELPLWAGLAGVTGMVTVLLLVAAGTVRPAGRAAPPGTSGAPAPGVRRPAGDRPPEPSRAPGSTGDFRP